MKQCKIIDVMMKFDDNRVVPACVTIYSASSTLHSDYELQFHILYNKKYLSDHSRNLINNLVDKLNNVLSIKWYNVPDYMHHNELESIPISKKWNECILYPLYESNILPLSVHRTIHLDEDICISSSLHELWELDPDAPYVAAGEVLRNPVLKYHHPIDILSMNPNFDPNYYTNCGVCVMNLDYCRKYNLIKEFIKLAFSHKLIWIEQSIFNQVFYYNTHRIGPEWNYAALFNYKSDVIDKHAEFITYNGNEVPYENIKIVHYYGWLKPWVFNNGLDVNLRCKWLRYYEALNELMNDNRYNIDMTYYDENKLNVWNEPDTLNKLLASYGL